MHGDFSAISGLDRKFDAVLFFESFHHCSNPQALIAALDQVIAPGGRVIFAGEPIMDGFPFRGVCASTVKQLMGPAAAWMARVGIPGGLLREPPGPSRLDVTKHVCSELVGAQAGWGVVFVGTRATS